MKKFHFSSFLYILLIIGGCTVLRPAKDEQPVRIENIKNPSPVTKENEQTLRSIRSIAITSFVERKSVSNEWAEEVIRLFGGRKVTIEGPDAVRTFLARINKSIEELTNDERSRLAQRIGKALKTDGVIIGIIYPLGKEDNRRVSVELIQTSTGKVLWWQVLDLTIKMGLWEFSKEDVIKRIVPELLGKLPELLGTSERLEKPEPKKPIIDISPM